MPNLDAVDAGWHQLSTEVIREMKAWRQAHPRATFREIEQALDEQLARLRARMLQDTALLSGTTDVRTLDETERPLCPQCSVRMEPRGQRSRELTTHFEQTIELKRSYTICPQCQLGIFPPR